MKTTRVDAEGNVRCPVCGAIDSFTVKRTGKGKLVAGLLAPKLLKCNGCGTNLKRSGINYPPPKPKQSLVSQHSASRNLPQQWQDLAMSMANKHGTRQSDTRDARILRTKDGIKIARYVFGSAKIEIAFSNARQVAQTVPGAYCDSSESYVKIPLSQAGSWEELVERSLQERSPALDGQDSHSVAP